jgi:pimeloyl-ACP methyl ester carboxylesterase
VPHAEINGFQMYYEVRGEGEPLVCATGWGLLTGERVVTIPQQIRDNYQVIVYDHRGLGQSSMGPDEKWTTQLFAEDVAGLMAHLGLERAHILGRGGLGACIMQHFAIRHPEKVQSLVLSGGWPGPDPLHEAQDRLFKILLEKAGFEAFQLYGAVICYTPEHFNAHHERLLSPDGPWSDVRDHREAHLKLIDAVIEHDAYDELPTITAPTLLIHGDDTDFLSGQRIGKLLQARIPGSRLVVLPNAPHSIASVPAAQRQFGEAMAEFLSEHSLVHA